MIQPAPRKTDHPQGARQGDSEGDTPITSLLWPRSVQVVLFACVSAGLLCYAAGLLLATTPSLPAQAGEFRVDLNQATHAELQLLPGIGDKTAQAILAYRESLGRFSRVEELDDVPGIGPLTFARLRAFVFVVEPVPAQSRQTYLARFEKASPGFDQAKQTAEPLPAKVRNSLPKDDPAPGSPARKTTRINVNHATAAELVRLPGIGKVLSSRIVEYRNMHGSFRTLDDLDNVPGIGPKTLARIEPLFDF